MDKGIEHTVIIGSGVAGLASGIYLSRAGLSPLILGGSPPGGQLTLTSDVENYPGYDSILGAELVSKMRGQAEKFGTRIVDENVARIEAGKDGAPHRVTTASGKTYETRSIIIATGAKALWLGLESEKRLRGKGVSACATCDGFFFRNKTVAVIGGGDTALEDAHTLTKFAAKVYIVHRRDSFRASKIMQKRALENSKIEVIWNAAVEEVLGVAKVEGLRVKTPEGVKDLLLDGVFVAIGHKPDTDLVKGIVALDKRGYIITASRAGMEYAFGTNKETIERSLFDGRYQSATSTKGIFAAGDCADIHYRQAATATGMGVAAALDVERWLENLKEGENG